MTLERVHKGSTTEVEKRGFVPQVGAHKEKSVIAVHMHAGYFLLGLQFGTKFVEKGACNLRVFEAFSDNFNSFCGVLIDSFFKRPYL